jgi:hypothetical protein
MTDTAVRMTEARAAQDALDQFLSPAFEVVRRDYAEKLMSIAAKPLTNDGRAAIEKLALAVKVVDEVKRQIEGIVNDGKVAEGEREHASRISKIPTTTRNLLGIAV